MNMCGYYLDAGMVGYTFRGMFGSYVSGDIYIKIVQNTRDTVGQKSLDLGRPAYLSKK